MSELESSNLSLRPTPELLARIDALAKNAQTATGITTRRGTVAISALELGVEELERQAKRGTKGGAR